MLSAFIVGCGSSNSKGDKEKAGEEVPEVAEESLPAQKDPVTADEKSADDLALQDNPHLRFKNVPIDGPLDKFVARMQRSGFRVEKKKAGRALLSGDFADFKKCSVYVETLADKDLVSQITVYFPDHDQWQALYEDYAHLKELLTAKYGKPSSCVEKFQSAYGLESKDDQMKMLAVNDGKCKYVTRFATDKGEIVLSIEHEEDEAFAVLSYKDNINGNIIKKHAIDDL